MAKPKTALRSESEIGLYESLCRLSEEMKRESESGEWDRIVLLEEERRILLENLQSGTWREEALVEKKIGLIQRILSADQSTSVYVKQRMVDLRRGFKTERTLLIKTYGQQALC